MEELEAQVSSVGLAVGAVRSVSEIAESEWAQARGAIREVDDRSGGLARMPAPPWLFGADSLPDGGLPPFQGEHNAEVLADLGFEQADIDALASRGITIRSMPD